MPDGGIVGVRIDFDAIPANARHIIVEGQLNGGSWLPFSQRAKFESGQGYMKFRSDISSIEAQGERNELHLSFAKGLSNNDIVKYRVAAEDDVGNRSAFQESSAITLSPDISQLFIEDLNIISGETSSIRVHLIGSHNSIIYVDVKSVDGTATSPEDFVEVNTNIQFDPDSSGHQYIDVPVVAIGTEPKIGEYSFTVKLSNVTGAAIITNDTGNVTLYSADVIPYPSKPWAQTWKKNAWRGTWT